MALLSDEKSNGPQFSKLVIIFCLLTMIIGTGGALVASILFAVPESILCALIAAAGGCGMTAVVWYLKKSQAENTMKMYLSSFKEIAEMKQDMSILDDIEEKILGEMEESIDMTLDDATSLIEKQDI